MSDTAASPLSPPAAAPPVAPQPAPAAPVAHQSETHATAAALAEMSPDARHRRVQADTDAGRYDPARVVQTRDAKGNVVTKDRATGAVIDGPANPDAPLSDPAATGEKVKIGDFEVSESEVREMLADKAQRDLARTQIPADPKGYELKLPEGVTLPGDAKVTFGTDPESLAMVDAAQQWAHKKGLSQSEFSELLSIQAHDLAAKELKIATYARAEVEKLGATGPQRIDAMTKWIRSEMGDTDAKPIIASMATAAHVKFYEKLFMKSTGAGNFRQTGRVDEPRGVDEATWNGMSYSEKKAYAERASSQSRR
jgi:hypothetical protein